MRAIQSQAFARNPTLVDFGALRTPYRASLVARGSRGSQTHIRARGVCVCVVRSRGPRRGDAVVRFRVRPSGREKHVESMCDAIPHREHI